MKGKSGAGTLDGIKRAALPPLPPEIQSPDVLESAAPAPATLAAPVPEHAPPPVAPAPVAQAPAPQLTPPAVPGVASPAPAMAPPPSAPNPAMAPPPAPVEPTVTMDLGGMFPPTGEEVAAQLEAEQAAAAARKAEAKAEKEAAMSRVGKRSKKPKVDGGKVDLRPPGVSPVVKTALNVIAGLAVLGVLYAGFLFYQRVQAATLVTELASGQCVENFFSPTEGEFRNVFVVGTTDCANPHAYEVFSTASTVFVDAGSNYPGVERTFAIGQEFCQSEYDSFVGGTFATSPWQVWTFVPTELRWENGERKVQCLVGDAAERNLVEGSLEGKSE